VDPKRIYIAGYSLGGNVALHLAALDSRVAGVAAFR
jgi:dienelactone hydrolase